MNRYFKFLLVSRHDDAFQIRNEIERNKLYEVRFTSNPGEAAQAINKGQLDCLVFNFEVFSDQQIQVVKEVRRYNDRFPVVTFANHIHNQAYEFVRRQERMVIIEKPFESKDVWGICEKLVQGRMVYQRLFRRFYTDQLAAIEKTLSGEVVNAQIYNLSRGGAYLELDTHGRMKPGEIVKMSINLEKVSRSYNVDAEVVWSSARGYWKGKPAAGLKFMKASDVYRNLLDKL